MFYGDLAVSEGKDQGVPGRTVRAVTGRQPQFARKGLNMINRLKRAAALGAATVALATGAVVGMVGTASAAPQNHRPPAGSHHCQEERGQWARHWQPAFRDRHHRWHPGHWTRVWRPVHRDCHR